MDKFIAIVAYITPYFLIPWTFKYGLGVFGNLAGMVNDRSRGFFDKQRKFRENSRASARQKASEGNRFASGSPTGNKFQRGLHKLNEGVANTRNAPGAILDNGALFRPGDGRWKGAVEARRTTLKGAEQERNAKENQALQPILKDDDVMKVANEAHGYGSTVAGLRAIDARGAAEDPNYEPRFADPAVLHETASAIETARRSMSAGAFKQVTSQASIEGGTAHADAFETLRSVALSAGTDASSIASGVAAARGASMGAGRLESGGAGFGTTLGSALEIKKAYESAGPDGLSEADEANLRKKINKQIYKSVLEDQGPATLAHPSLKPQAVQQLAPELFSLLEEDAQSSATQYAAATTDEGRRQAERAVMQRLATVSAVHDATGGAGTKKGAIIAKEVLDKELSWDQLPEPLQQAVLRKYGSDYPTTVQRRPISVTGDDGQVREVMQDVAVPTPPEKITVQRAMEAARSNEQFQQLHKEFATEIASRGGQPLTPSEIGAGAAPGPATRPLT